MSDILRYAAAVIVGVHGLIHLMGFVAYWPLAEIKELPYKTTQLEGRVDLGRRGMRVVSVLWLLAATGFVLSVGGMVADQGWWQALMGASAVLSMVISALDWSVAFRGTLIDIVILCVLLIAQW
jgi:hypothetical protein